MCVAFMFCLFCLSLDLSRFRCFVCISAIHRLASLSHALTLDLVMSMAQYDNDSGARVVLYTARRS